MGTWTLRRPLLVAGITAFVASLAAIHVTPWMALVAAGVLLMAALCLRRYYNAVFILLCGALLLVTGGVYCHREVWPVTALDGQEDTLTGVVTERNGHWTVVQVQEAERVPIRERVLLYVEDTMAPSPGERIRSKVKLALLSPSQSYWQAEGLFLCAYPIGYGEESLDILPADTPPDRLTRCRQVLTAAMEERLPGQEGALLTAICFGDRGGLSDGVENAFRAAGLTHLLVVSGLHLTLISGCVLGVLLLCRCRRRVAAVMSMGVTVAFMLFVGLSASVVRAGLMCLVLLAGMLFRRPADPLNSMGLALVGILLVNPYGVQDAGLLLSFGATAGVLTVTPRLYGLMAGWLPKREGLLGVGIGFLKSLVAGLAACGGALIPLTPLLVMLFGQLSWTAPLSNLLTVIPSGWSLGLGWLAALCMVVPFPPLVWLGEGLLFLAATTARFMLWVVSRLGTAGCQVTVPAGWRWVMLTVGCGTVLLWLFRPSYVRRRGLAMLLALTVLVSGFCYGVEHRSVQLWAAGTKDDGVLLVQQAEHSLLLATHSGALWRGQQLLEDAGVRSPDGVIVPYGETVDAGRLAALMRQYTPAAVYTTDSARWTRGVPGEVLYEEEGATISLWEGATVSSTDEGWYLTVADTALEIRVTADETAVIGEGLYLPLVTETPYRLMWYGGCWRQG